MKFLKNKQLSAYLLGAAIGVTIALPLNISAAPGILANEPLFLTNKAEPNIFFMVDDSGSMDMEMATDEPELLGINGSTGLMHVTVPSGGYYGWLYVFGDSDNNYTTELPGPNGFAVPTQESVDATYLPGLWRARNHNYNSMYYNPTTIYKPWAGVDNAGSVYQDAYIAGTPTWNTRKNPYLSASTTVDLSANVTYSTKRPNYTATGNTAMSFTYMPARYWFWEDTNTNNIVDAADSKTLVEIKSTNTICTGGLNATATEQKTGCMLRAYDDEMKNFANWWTYSRRREYATKNALVNVVKNSNGVRMGLGTINRNATTAGEKEMASMNADITSGNKKLLTDAIFSIQSNNPTPLHRALTRSGHYFTASNADTDPFDNNGAGNTKFALDTSVPTGATGAPAECSQNFTVLMTDGFYSDSSVLVGNADGGTSSAWTGDYDPENDGTMVSNSFSFDGAPYADLIPTPVSDPNFNTLADVAMHYYEQDLAGAIANKVPIRCGLDENPGQHMVTYTVAFGVNGTIDPTTLPEHPKRGYANSCTATTGSAFTWTDPLPVGNDAEKIDDLIHAAYNGRGEYLNASNPTALSTRLTDAFRSITSRIGAASGVTFNTNVLNSNSKLFRARFNSTQWSGELEAISLDAYGVLATTVDWEAGSVLSTRDISINERAIVTYKPSTNTAVAFRWASLDASQQTDLRTDSTGVAEVTASYPRANARLDFIRGSRDCEIGSSGTCAISKEFRSRGSRLGDLIHSQPIYSGVPTQRWPEEAPFGVAPENFSAYKSGIAAASAAFSSGKTAYTRTEMLYIGGNDGMLHAFNATNGEEVYAYIPSMLYSTATGNGLHALTEPSYSHKYYVDHSPTISEAYIDTGSGDDWHSVLVGGLRGGGRGLFALNVTDPDAVINAANITAKETAVISQVMWEFTNTDDADLGYSFSRPAIVPLGTSSGVEWYAVFGNGYNADTSGGADGKSKLFLLKLEGPGVDNVWDLGTDYFKITTGVGDTTTNINGLSTPTLLDLNGDSIADRAYAGDLLGNMWAFDLEGSSGWDVAHKSGATTPVPLFIATDGDAGAGNKQPITSQPVIIRHPTVATVTTGSGNLPNLMIYFGTGQYITAADLSNTSTQSFYAVWDRGDDQRTVHRTTPADASNHLIEKEFTNPTSLSRTGGVQVVDYSVSGVYGWYYDLPDPGERVTTNPAIRGDIVFFNTLIPSLEPCGYGGSGWELGVNTADGSSTCGTFDTNGDGILDCAGDVSSAGTKKIGSVPMESSFIGGGGGSTPTGTLDKGAASCSQPTAPTPLTCPGGQKNVLVRTTDGSGCNTYGYTCGDVCEAGKKPVTRWTTNSDGSQSQSTICISDADVHTGRFSWRELPF